MRRQSPKVLSLLETALYVHDLSRATDFYRRIFGFSTLFESQRLVALDVAGKNVLLLFAAGMTSDDFETPGGTIPGHGTHGPAHFAFGIAKEELETWRSQLAAEEVPVESTVVWPSGTVSLYFRDPDRNLVELITPGFWRTF